MSDESDILDMGFLSLPPIEAPYDPFEGESPEEKIERETRMISNVDASIEEWSEDLLMIMQERPDMTEVEQVAALLVAMLRDPPPDVMAPLILSARLIHLRVTNQ